MKVWFVGAAKYRLESVDGIADSRILVQVSLASFYPAQKQAFDTSSFVTLPSGKVFEKYCMKASCRFDGFSWMALRFFFDKSLKLIKRIRDAARLFLKDHYDPH